MLIYDNKNWFSFLFKWRINDYPNMLWSLVTMLVISILLCYIVLELQWFKLNLPASSLSATSLVVGLLLVFRTNTAYERWWEGRKLLGQLMNTSRFLALKFSVYFENESTKGYCSDLLKSFIHSLRERLMVTNYDNSIKFLKEEDKINYFNTLHKPSYILRLLSLEFIKLQSTLHINPFQFTILEQQLSILTDIIGACERIKYTPMPYSYAMHLKRIIFIFCIFLPFTLVHELSWWTVPVVGVVFYTLVGIEIIGEEIEDPFGNDKNDLPVDEVIGNIERNIESIIKKINYE